MRRFVLAAAMAWSAPALADGFRDDLTFENFGSRVEVAARVAFPGIPIEVEANRCHRLDEGALFDRCSYVIAGRPVDVQSDIGGPADYVRIFATADNGEAIATMVDLSALMVMMLDPENAESVVEEVYEATRRAAVSGRSTQVSASNFDLEFGPDSTGHAVVSVFRAR